MCYIKIARNVREVINVTSSIIAAKLRDHRGKTPRSEVCKAVGISLSTLQMYENGERIPRGQIKTRLASYYNTTVGELFFEEKPHETCD